MEDTRFTEISGSPSGSEPSAAGTVFLTEAAEDGLADVTVAVAGAGAAEVTEAMTGEADITGAVASAQAAWWRAARRRLRFLSEGPRCRGR